MPFENLASTTLRLLQRGLRISHRRLWVVLSLHLYISSIANVEEVGHDTLFGFICVIKYHEVSNATLRHAFSMRRVFKMAGDGNLKVWWPSICLAMRNDDKRLGGPCTVETYPYRSPSGGDYRPPFAAQSEQGSRLESFAYLGGPRRIRLPRRRWSNLLNV